MCEWKTKMKKLTKQQVEAAPMFTVWKDMRGKVECQDVPMEWWFVSGLEHATIFSEGVKAKAAEKCIEVLDVLGGPFEIERDDSLMEELGTSDTFDDIDGALCALEFGFTLVKLPDKMDSPYWRMYVVGPVPAPWSKHDCFKAA